MSLPHQRFHINDKGETGACSALIQCPFGGKEKHYPTPEAAREAYEASMAAGLVPEPFYKPLGFRNADMNKLQARFDRAVPNTLSSHELEYDDESGDDVALIARPDGSQLHKALSKVADEDPWRDIAVGLRVKDRLNLAFRRAKLEEASQFLREESEKEQDVVGAAFLATAADKLEHPLGVVKYKGSEQQLWHRGKEVGSWVEDGSHFEALTYSDQSAEFSSEEDARRWLIENA